MFGVITSISVLLPGGAYRDVPQAARGAALALPLVQARRDAVPAQDGVPALADGAEGEDAVKPRRRGR